MAATDDWGAHTHRSGVEGVQRPVGRRSAGVRRVMCLRLGERRHEELDVEDRISSLATDVGSTEVAERIPTARRGMAAGSACRRVRSGHSLEASSSARVIASGVHEIGVRSRVRGTVACPPAMSRLADRRSRQHDQNDRSSSHGDQRQGDMLHGSIECSTADRQQANDGTPTPERIPVGWRQVAGHLDSREASMLRERGRARQQNTMHRRRDRRRENGGAKQRAGTHNTTTNGVAHRSESGQHRPRDETHRCGRTSRERDDVRGAHHVEPIDMCGSSKPSLDEGEALRA